MGAKAFCDANDAAFAERYEQRQKENQALADALVALTGAEFLSVDSSSALHLASNPVDDLCLMAIGISEKEWHVRAKDACAKAKNGLLQDASDEIEALQEDIKVAQRKAEDERQDCAEASRDLRAT